MIHPSETFDPAAITRPDPALMRYYTLGALCSLIFFPIVLLPLYFKYHTMRYSFDEDGIAMSWGILFRREISLTYRRIQDIQVTRNIFQRWMGLATVSIQTASGSSTPEMQIEGVLQYEALRDYLYTKMRGAKGHTDQVESSAPAEHDEALVLLRSIAADLASVRESLRRGGDA